MLSLHYDCNGNRTITAIARARRDAGAGQADYVVSADVGLPLRCGLQRDLSFWPVVRDTIGCRFGRADRLRHESSRQRLVRPPR